MGAFGVCNGPDDGASVELLSRLGHELTDVCTSDIGWDRTEGALDSTWRIRLWIKCVVLTWTAIQPDEDDRFGFRAISLMRCCSLCFQCKHIGEREVHPEDSERANFNSIPAANFS